MMVAAQMYFNLLLYKTPPLTLIRDHAMAQAVSYRLLTSEAEFASGSVHVLAVSAA
jgi:hypothetical protein